MDKFRYLLTKELMVRQQIAAYFAKDYPHIIEIGGYINNVSNYLNLNKHKSVLIVDPLLENKKEGNLTYFNGVATDLKSEDMRQYGPRYCLIALGCWMCDRDLTGGRLWRRHIRRRDMAMRRQESSFIDLAKNADMIIIENDMHYTLSKKQSNKLTKILTDDLGFKLYTEITFDNYKFAVNKVGRQRFMRIYKNEL